MLLNDYLHNFSPMKNPDRPSKTKQVLCVDEESSYQVKNQFAHAIKLTEPHHVKNLPYNQIEDIMLGSHLALVH